nr:hypothetical protein [Tanacetum cinerariifolium]
MNHMILMILTWSLRKILKKSLRRDLKRTLKKSQRRLQRWRVEREGTRVENIKLKRELEATKISNTTSPGEATDVLAVYGESQPPKPRGPPKNAGGCGPTNARGVVALDVHGYSYKTFMNCQPHSFNRLEGVITLTRWFEKMEQVFEISKCAEEDKTNVKTMMTTEYCPTTEIQKMEQELWTLTAKGYDIEEYNNRFHELSLMCPYLVTHEKKKIERYIRGLPERVKANVTSSKHASLHDVIYMARKLIEQAIKAKATRIGERNKRKWEDHQRNNSNNRNNNTYHRQQNRRQEAVEAYVAAPAEGKVYLGNLPL